MRIRFIFAAALAGLASVATAMPAEARVNKRQNQQQQRIANGISKGSLTPQETIRLEQQQARIARYRSRNRADGRGLNRAERRRLSTMQNNASRNIYRKKHNARRR